jgi:hypothetical protein
VTYPVRTSNDLTATTRRPEIKIYRAGVISSSKDSSIRRSDAFNNTPTTQSIIRTSKEIPEGGFRTFDYHNGVTSMSSSLINPRNDNNSGTLSNSNIVFGTKT